MGSAIIATTISSVFQRIIAFRKAHPSIARSDYWREDIKWYGRARDVDFSPEGQTLAYCLHGKSVNDSDIYVMINASTHEASFRVQEGKARDWLIVADTYLPSPDDIADAGKEERSGLWLTPLAPEAL